MKDGISIIIGVVILNLIILLYEKQGLGLGWRIYGGLVAVLILSTIFLPLGFMLLLPITGYNLIVNTTRFQNKMKGR